MRFLLFFAIFFLVFQLFSKKDDRKPTDDIGLFLKNKIPIGREVQVQIKNYRQTPIEIPIPCPKNPLKTERYDNGEWVLRLAEAEPGKCETKTLTIEPDKTQSVNFGPWNSKLFDRPGHYRISLVTQLDGKEKSYSREFDVKEPGFIQWIGTHVFYKPIFNTLIYLISVIPNHDLGWGIILLTLLIKILLLTPNQHALKSQRAMQHLQPELDAIKLKYKDDKAKLASETMALWKKHKVHPLNSCLPILIQFPILIALFYVVKDGLTVINPEIFYEPLRSFNLAEVNINFFGLLDLTKANIIVLPIIVGGLQFLQMHLTFAKTKPIGQSNDPMAMMGKTMKYMMPVMIAIFTAGLPAAVGFYWGISTLFGIGQQAVVNKMKI